MQTAAQADAGVRRGRTRDSRPRCTRRHTGVIRSTSGCRFLLLLCILIATPIIAGPNSAFTPSRVVAITPSGAFDWRSTGVHEDRATVDYTIVDGGLGGAGNAHTDPALPLWANQLLVALLGLVLLTGIGVIAVELRVRARERELGRLNAQLNDILDSITDGFLAVDADWHFRYVNREAARIMGSDPEKLIGRDARAVFPVGLGTPFAAAFRRAMTTRTPASLQEYYPPLGIWLDVRAYPTEDGVTLYFRDITEHQRMLERLNRQETDLRESYDRIARVLETRQKLINALPAHIALLDREGTVLDVNEQWRHYGVENHNTDPGFGVDRNYLAICSDTDGHNDDEASAVATQLRELLRGERETFALEYPCHAPGHQHWFRIMANRIGSSGPHAETDGAVVMHLDITERKLAEQELNRAAYKDSLTGLYSRNGFAQALHTALSDDNWQESASVVMFDIEQFRDINDAHGYEAGDRLLVEIGQRMNHTLGEQTTNSRVGGDEFAVFLPVDAGQSPLERRGALASIFASSFEVDGQMIEVTARFGYTQLDGSPRGAEDLLREAELALFQNRYSQDASQWVAYSAELDVATRERISITRALKRALSNDEFELHFHPKVTLEDGELVACEALIRWHRPGRGLQSPATFIPIAEQSQLIGPIGDWAVREACSRLRQWRDAGLEIVRVAVNVSVVQFAVGNFAATVRDALDAHGVEPSGLTLEITESVFERESEALQSQLRTLHELGVRLSLDDFGTGYSSLLYLQRYPFDEIKIDQGFVRCMLDDEYSRRIVQTVIGVAGALGAEVIAEGVEDKAVRDALIAMGCVMGQGYYYSMPLEAEDFQWLLTRRSRLPLADQALA